MQNLDKYFILFSGTAAMLLLAMAIVLFFIVHQKKLLKQEHEKQQLELRYQTELLYSNLKTLESERARVAADLHDDIGASLSALRLQLSRVDRQAPSQGAKELADAREIIDHTIDSVKRISYDLFPPGLEAFGLGFVVSKLFDTVSGNTGFEVVVDAPAELYRYDHTTELALYRILQELTNNSIKHSGGTHIYVSLNQTQEKLELTYSDNGSGYDYTLMEKGSGQGLKNIKSRMNLIGGLLRPGSVNELVLTLPVTKNTPNG